MGPVNQNIRETQSWRTIFAVRLLGLPGNR